MGNLIVMFVKKKVGKLPLKMLKMGANCCQNVEKIEQIVVENVEKVEKSVVENVVLG